jgi:hypothetical protein
MNYQLLTIKASDDIFFLYPLNFLARNCGYINDIVSNTTCIGGIDLPFTSEEIDAFLYLLETRTAPENVVAALRVGDFLLFDLTEAEIYQMIDQLDDIDNIKQIDKFVLSRGYSKLSMESLIDAFTHLDELRSFEGVSWKDRFDQASAQLQDKDTATWGELLDIVFPVIESYFIRQHIVCLTLAKDKMINSASMNYLKMMMPMIGRFLYNGDTDIQSVNRDVMARVIRQHAPNLVAVPQPTWWQRLRSHMPF